MSRLFRQGRMQLMLATEDIMQRLNETSLVSCRVNDPRDRCHLNEQFGFSDPTNQTWKPPANARTGIFEGPRTFGEKNPFCQDCMGCYTTKTDCGPLEHPAWDNIAPSMMNSQQKQLLLYGGFIGMEFARDVELQTDMFPTSQENIAHYLSYTWNVPELLQVWQKPTCLVNTAHHDVTIRGITMDAYIANVQWYLHLLVQQCGHILWLATTAPQHNNFTQRIEATETWGLAVKNMMGKDPLLRNKTLYIDLFEASVSFPHDDNIHMGIEWYRSLATLFQAETFLDCV